MPKYNADIAANFEEIADLLEIQGGNPFRIRAYRNAARDGRVRALLGCGEKYPASDRSTRQSDTALQIGGCSAIRGSVGKTSVSYPRNSACNHRRQLSAYAGNSG